jgi:hypothetical protein
MPECSVSFMLNVVYAEITMSHFAECHYAECRGVNGYSVPAYKYAPILTHKH